MVRQLLRDRSPRTKKNSKKSGPKNAKMTKCQKKRLTEKTCIMVEIEEYLSSGSRKAEEKWPWKTCKTVEIAEENLKILQSWREIGLKNLQNSWNCRRESKNVEKLKKNWLDAKCREKSKLEKVVNSKFQNRSYLEKSNKVEPS